MLRFGALNRARKVHYGRGIKAKRVLASFMIKRDVREKDGAQEWER